MQAHVGGTRVAFHAFEPGDACGGLGHGHGALARCALPGDHFHEFVHRQSTGVARSAGGWQDMVGASGFVTVGDRGFLAQKQRAVTFEAPEPPVEIFGLHGQVLWGVVV